MTSPHLPTLAALLLIAAPAAAADPPPSTLERWESEARRALDLLSDEMQDMLRNLGDGVETLGEYGPPRMLPNGDILIPRNRPEPGSETAPNPKAPAPVPADPKAPVPADPDAPVINL